MTIAGPRFLLVDDHALFRMGLGLMLAELRLRRGRQYNAAGRGDPALPLLLTGWRAWLASR
mgnify:CR=1 FL=1